MEAIYWNGKDKSALLYNGGVLWRANGRKFADLPNLPKPIGPAKMGWYHCIAANPVRDPTEKVSNGANVCGDEREEAVLYNPWDKYVWIFSPEPLKPGAFEGYKAGPRQYNPRLMD